MWGQPPPTGASPRNWYNELGLEPDAPSEVVADAVEPLSRQASALANTAPKRSQQLRDTIRAMRQDLMSGPEARRQYDERLARTPPFRPAGPDHLPHETVAYPEPTWSPPGPSVATPATPVADVIAGTVLPMVARFRRFLQTGWTCPSCAEEGSPGDRFCTRCGAAMKQASQSGGSRCANCSNQLSAEERFCTRCGSPRAWPHSRISPARVHRMSRRF